MEISCVCHMYITRRETVHIPIAAQHRVCCRRLLVNVNLYMFNEGQLPSRLGPILWHTWSPWHHVWFIRQIINIIVIVNLSVIMIRSVCCMSACTQNFSTCTIWLTLCTCYCCSAEVSVWNFVSLSSSLCLLGAPLSPGGLNLSPYALDPNYLPKVQSALVAHMCVCGIPLKHLHLMINFIAHIYL